jgi:hypothetical protein
MQGPPTGGPFAFWRSAKFGALITVIVSGSYAIVHVTSYVPAIINGVSAVGLAVFVVALRTHGYSTLYGTAIGLLMPCYMVGWTWNSWPRVRRAAAKL